MAKLLDEKRDRIAYVTINRPEARNAIGYDKTDAGRAGEHETEL
jgi:enoyl-CoA hydratase/carnithine racemase